MQLQGDEMQSVAEELFGPPHGVALRAESFPSGGRRASEHRVQQDAHAHAAGDSRRTSSPGLIARAARSPRPADGVTNGSKSAGCAACSIL